MSRLLGIDASADSVRLALVRTSYRRVALEAFVEVDVASAGSELEALRAATVGMKPEGISIGLSGEKSFYRQIELPAAAQKEIQNVLGFELEATAPFEMDGAVFDYRVMKRARGSVEALPIFAAIARIDDVKNRIDLVRDAIGVEPERVGTGPSPLANLTVIHPELEHPSLPGPIALVNIAERTTDILILVEGEGGFARTLSRGTMSLIPDGGAAAMVRELRQTIASFRAAGGAPVVAMVLFGPGSELLNAPGFLASELGLPVMPLAPPKLDGLTAETAAQVPRFGRALGLALGMQRQKSFNMRRGALEPERRYPFLREKVPLLVGLAAVIAVSFGFSVVAEMRTLAAEHELLVAKLAVASNDVLGEETTDPDKAKELLEGPGKEEDDPMPHADGFDAMVQISKAVPKDVVHDVVELDYSRQHVNLQGTVPSVGDAEAIAKGLKEYKCARDVKIARTSQFGEGKQKYVLEFDLKCTDPKKKKVGETEGASSAAASSAHVEPAKDAGK